MTPKEAFSYTTSRPWITAGEDVQYCVELVGSEIRVLFQCSVSSSDWMHNFDFAVEPYSDMPTPWKAHRGFVRLWKSVRKEVIAKISTLLASDREIVVLGYSQGAAIAVLCYEDVAFTYPAIPLRGIGFGTPRVVWGSAVIGRWPTFTRHCVRGDLVVHLPPALIGYRHVGTALWYGPPALPAPSHHAEYAERLP